MASLPRKRVAKLLAAIAILACVVVVVLVVMSMRHPAVRRGNVRIVEISYSAGSTPAAVDASAPLTVSSTDGIDAIASAIEHCRQIWLPGVFPHYIGRVRVKYADGEVRDFRVIEDDLIADKQMYVYEASSSITALFKHLPLPVQK